MDDLSGLDAQGSLSDLGGLCVLDCIYGLDYLCGLSDMGGPVPNSSLRPAYDQFWPVKTRKQ